MASMHHLIDEASTFFLQKNQIRRRQQIIIGIPRTFHRTKATFSFNIRILTSSAYERAI
jgi:hypothetical protein